MNIKMLQPFCILSLILLFASMIQGIVEQRFLQAISSAIAYWTLGLIAVLNSKQIERIKK